MFSRKTLDRPMVILGKIQSGSSVQRRRAVFFAVNGLI
jgi:hypothetical protein